MPRARPRVIAAATFLLDRTRLVMLGLSTILILKILGAAALSAAAPADPVPAAAVPLSP